MKVWRAIIAAALIVGLGHMAVLATSAQGDPTTGKETCAPPNVRTDVRPGPEGLPTEVTVGVGMIDLLGINDVSQTLTGDFAVVLSWTDPRLAHLEGCHIPLQDVWVPGVNFINSGRKFPSLPNEVDIGPGGSIRYTQRYGGAFSSYHNLRKFPFDKQVFRIWLVPLDYLEDEVVLAVDEKITRRRDLLNISDWTINGVEGTVDRMKSEAYDGYYSRYTFAIHANRITGFYVWKVILPLCLIVAMSWAVFWIDPAEFGPQLGLSATSVLTMIAFLFATTNMLPALGYFTILDLFIGGATILVFLAMLESLTTSYLISKGKVELALHLDRACRFVFPLGFVLMIILVFYA
jgi:hypothetical protein